MLSVLPAMICFIQLQRQICICHQADLHCLCWQTRHLVCGLWPCLLPVICLMHAHALTSEGAVYGQICYDVCERSRTAVCTDGSAFMWNAMIRAKLLWPSSSYLCTQHWLVPPPYACSKCQWPWQVLAVDHQSLADSTYMCTAKVFS